VSEIDGGGVSSGGGSTGLLRCLRRLVSLVFLTRDRGSCWGSSVKDQGLNGLTGGSHSGLVSSSRELRRIRFFGGCKRVGVRSLFLESFSTSLTPESSECAGPEQESSSSPPDTKPASRSKLRSGNKESLLLAFYQ
jgi:hypothetical protein